MADYKKMYLTAVDAMEKAMTLLEEAQRKWRTSTSKRTRRRKNQLTLRTAVYKKEPPVGGSFLCMGRDVGDAVPYEIAKGGQGRPLQRKNRPAA